MPYYRIREIDFREEPDSYYVFQGGSETEVKLNQGFSQARELLEAVAALSTGERPLSVFMLYQHEQLSYFLKADDPAMLPMLERRVPHCRWEQVGTEPSPTFAKERVILHGCAAPLVIKDRQENLLDELVRMLPQEDFLIQVKLGPKDPDRVQQELQRLEGDIRQLSRQAEQTVGDQGNLVQNVVKSVFGGESLSYQVKNMTARQQLGVLENHHASLATQGTVFTSVEFHIYAGAGMAEIIASKMIAFSRRSGSMSLYQLRRGELPSREYLRFAPCNHVAALLAFPITGVPGLHLKQRVSFGVDLPDAGPNALPLGHLVRTQETGIPVSIPLKDLTRHVFVAGVTGSGKTSTIKSLLLQVHARNKPFLVLEPAKTEYKYLDQRIPSLQRYTLGLEGSRSFKINPFAFPEHIHVQTHVDHLKSVFVAAFPMYGPMPYILETALFEIYRRSGWDLRTGRNIYEGRMPRTDLFPTLADLLAAIDEAIETVGYSNDVRNDVRGALRVRIGSLLTGAKGSMLNTRSGNSIARLLETPAVMELEYIGDDQEKVFLMGLLLVAIYEHYVSVGLHRDGLQHLLVIEEAHRLLENTLPSGSAETADVKGKAVETFNNMLSEIRTYGQGIVVADQIPSKLSPDVLKNTNLKILHRLFAADDRQLVGDAIGLEEEQVKELIRLREGEAVLFHGGIDCAMKVKIAVDPAILAERQSDPRRVSAMPFDLAEYLMQQDAFRLDCYRRVGAYLLFPGAKSGVADGAARQVTRTMGLPCDAAQLQAFWPKLIEGYLREMRVRERMPYVAEWELLQAVRGSADALECVRAWMDAQVAASEARHVMAGYCPIYQGYVTLRELLPGVSTRAPLHAASFHYESQPATEQILRESGIQGTIDTGMLGRQQRQQLAHAIMLAEFGENLPVLERYFGVEPLYAGQSRRPHP